MRAINKIKQIIEKNPQDKQSQIFSKLITSLAEDDDFPVKDFYELDNYNFDLAIEVLQEWRLDRYYLGKAKVFVTALQALELSSANNQ